MSFFLIKLIPPRPSFAQDMTAAERQVMQAHVGYWKGLAERGLVVVFGPVLDPEGVWGVAIVEVTGEPQVHELIADDPVKVAGLGTFKVCPMQVGALRSNRGASPGVAAPKPPPAHA